MYKRQVVKVANINVHNEIDKINIMNKTLLEGRLNNKWITTTESLQKMCIRDRLGREFSVVDTGGGVVNSDDIFEEEIRKQVLMAVSYTHLAQTTHVTACVGL